MYMQCMCRYSIVICMYIYHIYIYTYLCVYPLAANGNQPPNIIRPKEPSSPKTNSPSCLVHLAVRGVVLPRADAKGWRGSQGGRCQNSTRFLVPIATQRGKPNKESPFLVNLGQYEVGFWVYHGLPHDIPLKAINFLYGLFSAAHVPPLMFWEWTVMQCPSLPGPKPSGGHQVADVMGR